MKLLASVILIHRSRYEEVSGKYFYFSMKTCCGYSLEAPVVGTHWKCLAERLLKSTCNICFHGEIRKISIYFG